jgi:predicted glycosyltransferase
LLPLVLRHRPDLAISHGSRAQILIANLLRIPSVLICDYEFAKPFPLSRPTWEFVPEAIGGVFLAAAERVKKYPGIKEDVYVPDFEPDAGIFKELGLSHESIIVTVRPPATEAHYHNPESEVLFEHFMQRLTRTPGVVGVLLPRNKKQEEELRKKWPAWFQGAKVIVPDHAVDGLNLLWHSDLVVSGGGTMNREAAALGVPVYSIFRGKIGAVDRSLSQQQRLVLVETPEDVDRKILLTRRVKAAPQAHTGQSLRGIIRLIEEVLEIEHPGLSQKA